MDIQHFQIVLIVTVLEQGKTCLTAATNDYGRQVVASVRLNAWKAVNNALCRAHRDCQREQ